MVVISDEYIFSFDITMHVVILVKIVDSFTNVFEVPFDKAFAELAVAEFDLLVERTSGGVLQDHVGGVFLLLVVVVYQFDDVGVV